MSRRKGKEPQGQSSTAEKEVRDPRLDAVIDTLREIGHLMGLQAQERAVAQAQAQAAEAAAMAGNIGNQNQQEQAHPVRGRQMPQLVEQFIKLKPPNSMGEVTPRSPRGG